MRGENKNQKQRRWRKHEKAVRIRYASSFRYADILDLYIEDHAFRQAVDSGRYAFVDGKIVLNASRYIDFVDGRMALRTTIRDEDQYYCLHYRQEIEYSRGTGIHWGDARLQARCTPPHQPFLGFFQAEADKE